MIVSTRGSVLRLLAWQWRYAVLMVAAAAVAVAAHQWYGATENALPSLPMAVVGGALGIFVSFRTNSAYDRWWEGRKLWGGMVNVSRHFASQALHYVGQVDQEQARGIVRRHIAYVHALRCLLREQDPFEDEEFCNFMVESECRSLRKDTNLTHALLHQNFAELQQLVDKGNLSEFRMASMDTSIQDALNYQGGLERIKKTPMPRAYGFLAHQLVVAFSCLFPFSLAHDLGWFTLPLNLLVGLAFALISEAGRVLEDPFTMFYNGLPLMGISKTIEHNLRNRMGETDLPPLPQPVDGILM